ncbi:hypothetical protein SAMN05216338_1001370 [Bradyrhizobium sp. Rc2d]|uniref:hypothetical protein n=1 Tax=Bradyrhizobium sp. Rc2d TaxID=1855321 RepID=UPI000880F0DE|nr:hypothetical protein [Bradyrhizobium sp. Rc2d]SDG45597.1 hypothetical protein SAMN05216338_1001370 [Bradyrhizobium sp. Rc2d]
MADLNYVWEKFSTAIYSLAGNGPMRERLRSAYLSFHPVRIADFDDDPEMQADYREIMDRLTAWSEGYPGEGKVPSTLRQMNDEEADEVADLIIDFCFSVARARIEQARNSRT